MCHYFALKMVYYHSLTENSKLRLGHAATRTQHQQLILVFERIWLRNVSLLYREYVLTYIQYVHVLNIENFIGGMIQTFL